MEARIVPDLNAVAGLGGAFVGLTSLAFTWHKAWKKSDVDESAMVLTAWKNLMENQERHVKELVGEIANLRKRLVSAENRITELESERLEDRKRISDLVTENAGLKAAIAQNSRSAAQLLDSRSDEEKAADSAQDARDRRTT